jgi:uncharacterized protein (TIGR03084 family)
MTEVFDDLEAEQDALEAVLVDLPEGAWLSESAAAGWTIADVVLHLAQTEESVVATISADPTRTATAAWREYGSNVDDAMNAIVRLESGPPEHTFQRWRTARREAVAALRLADPAQPVQWVGGVLKPRTLATTRLAEHWAHALDVVTPLGIEYPDTTRLRHIAWLGHSTLPYAFALAGQEPHAVYCELSAPDGGTWTYGSPDAESSITGSASEFCRVGARRLTPDRTNLVATGPHGADALKLLRNYAS